MAEIKFRMCRRYVERQQAASTTGLCLGLQRATTIDKRGAADRFAGSPAAHMNRWAARNPSCCSAIWPVGCADPSIGAAGTRRFHRAHMSPSGYARMPMSAQPFDELSSLTLPLERA
jgi:hypothetical protein